MNSPPYLESHHFHGGPQRNATPLNSCRNFLRVLLSLFSAGLMNFSKFVGTTPLKGHRRGCSPSLWWPSVTTGICWKRTRAAAVEGAWPLSWTTTPCTDSSNTAVFCIPDLDAHGERNVVHYEQERFHSCLEMGDKQYSNCWFWMLCKGTGNAICRFVHRPRTVVLASCC